MAKTAIVVGGGVIGGLTAYYLAKRGWSVTVLDRGAFGAGCSHGNCGLVCPSHVLPLAEPGAIQTALKSLVTVDAPLSVKPRLDLRLWNWLWKFAQRCNERDMLRAGWGIQALLDSSLAEYERLKQRKREVLT